MKRILKNKAEDYEPMVIVIDPLKHPIAYSIQKNEFMQSGMTEEEAHEAISRGIEMELYYAPNQGLFMVESEAVDNIDIWNPYDGILMDMPDRERKPPFPITAITTKEIIFSTNEHSNHPLFVKLEFSREDFENIVEIQCMLKANKHIESVKMECSAIQLLDDKDPEDENTVWYPECESLIIHKERFFYYAQSKYDATDQIESEEITIDEFLKQQ